MYCRNWFSFSLGEVASDYWLMQQGVGVAALTVHTKLGHFGRLSWDACCTAQGEARHWSRIASCCQQHQKQTCHALTNRITTHITPVGPPSVVFSTSTPERNNRIRTLATLSVFKLFITAHSAHYQHIVPLIFRICATYHTSIHAHY